MSERTLQRTTDQDAPATSGNVFRCDCAGREILDHITSRWGLLIIALLYEGPLRFFELRERIGGVSEKMLSQTLRTLTRDGLVERSVQATRPPRVTYRLGPLGRDLAEPLRDLVDWISDNAVDVLAAQRRYDTTAS